MTVIYKYRIAVTDEQVVQMPRGADTLCCQIQSNVPCIWARVDSSQGLTERRFRIFGTGHAIPDGVNLEYLDTFQMPGLVFHIFEVL